MSRNGSQVGGNARPVHEDSLHVNYAIMLKSTFENNAEELLWIAEVMAGSRQAAEECVAEAAGLAEAAQYVGREWILPWAKRLLVHVALKRMSSEVREFLWPTLFPVSARVVKGGLSAEERRSLRTIPPQRIKSLCDALERACFILSAYLNYPLLDCALLLGVPRVWIEPICERAFTKIFVVAPSTEDHLKNADSFTFRGVTECEG